MDDGSHRDNEYTLDEEEMKALLAEHGLRFKGEDIFVGPVKVDDALFQHEWFLSKLKAHGDQIFRVRVNRVPLWHTWNMTPNESHAARGYSKRYRPEKGLAEERRVKERTEAVQAHLLKEWSSGEEEVATNAPS